MINIYLSHPAITSALGAGIEETFAHLRSGKSVLRPETGWLADSARTAWVGRFPHPLAELPENTPAYLQSRNNQLLETTLLQQEEALRECVARYGADRVAVVLGTSTTGSDENEQAFHDHVAGVPWRQTSYSQDKQLLASPAVYLAWRYGIRGPAYGISTACTSGAKTLISAARLLAAGMADAVICGGVDSLSPFTLNGFDSLSVLSDQPTRPFSGDRAGINIGEGAAIFIATREKSSNILLRGYGSGSDAYHMSTPRPDGAGIIQVMESALERAGLSTAEIGWINAHGTGTQANDASEALAIYHLFADTVPVTSTKAQTGHTLGSAGAIEAAIAWMVCDPQINPEGVVVPQWGLNVTDTALPGITLAQAEMPLAKGCRTVLSNSFAFGGNNSSLILGVDDA